MGPIPVEILEKCPSETHNFYYCVTLNILNFHNFMIRQAVPSTIQFPTKSFKSQFLAFSFLNGTLKYPISMSYSAGSKILELPTVRVKTQKVGNHCLRGRNKM
jgi:hypothetical protein